MEEDVVDEMWVEKLRTKKDIYELIRESWGFYKLAVLKPEQKQADSSTEMSQTSTSTRENTEKSYREIPDCDSVSESIDKQVSGAYLDEVTVVVPQEIAPWVQKLKTVLSGPARRALEFNLDTFVEYTALKEGISGPTPGESATDAIQQAVKAGMDAKNAIEEHLASRDRHTRRRGKTA